MFFPVLSEKHKWSLSIFRRKLGNKKNRNTSTFFFSPPRKDSGHLPDTSPHCGQHDLSFGLDWGEKIFSSDFFTLWIITSSLQVTTSVFPKTLPIMLCLVFHKLLKYFAPKLTHHNYQAFTWEPTRELTEDKGTVTGNRQSLFHSFADTVPPASPFLSSPVPHWAVSPSTKK